MQKYCSITQNDEDDFVDFSFDIIKFKKKLFGGTFLECAAYDEGNNVGFGLEIKKNMQGINNNNIKTFRTYSQGMKMTYLNGLSSKFIQSVARLYGFENTALQLKKFSFIECGALGGNPMNLHNEEVYFKCFLEPNDNEKYAEVYINVDLPNKKLYLKEKDPEYRENIIRYLSK